MSINWKGEAMMCCGDWENRCVLGDVAKTSITEIWHSACSPNTAASSRLEGLMKSPAVRIVSYSPATLERKDRQRRTSVPYPLVRAERIQ